MKNNIKLTVFPLALGLAAVVSANSFAQVKQRPASTEVYRHGQIMRGANTASAPVPIISAVQTRYRTETRTRTVPVTRTNGITENVQQSYTVTVPYQVTASVAPQKAAAPYSPALPTWTLLVDGWIDFEGFNIDRLHQGSSLLNFFDSLGRQCYLEPGDVISHVNGRKVTSINQFLGLVRNAPNPRQIHLQVINWRNGEILNFVIAAKKAG